MLAGFYVAVARTLPSLELTGAVESAQTTRIFDDGESPTLLAELHGAENRQILSSDDIPQVMRNAVVAIEDERFYEHVGVDFLGILRAAWANIRNQEIVQGGSTITQQYIKNAYVADEETLDRKLREAALAYQLEKRWSKEKILNEYLNIIYFGEGAYGIEAAAQEYFGVHASDLSLAQAAMLAGLPKAPSVYSPRRDPEAALGRRDLVLNKMYQQKYINSDQLQNALSTPLELADPHDREKGLVPYWVELIREQLVARYGSSTVLEGGLRVYTSVDLKLQEAAEDAVSSILNQAGDPSAALVSVDVRTGRLVAMVGGADFSKSQFNLATQGRRQPGSAFKPFVLIAALRQGISPDTLYESGSVAIDVPGGIWKVESTDLGAISLRDATAQSSNGVYARLVMDVGADAVAQTAYEMGIQTSLGDNPKPAIALGGLTTGVSPLEMAMAYATLATGGERISSSIIFDESKAGLPVTIVRVTDSAGAILDESEPVRTRVLDAGLSAVATWCLEAVIADGTGKAADIGRPAAGKTGTTQNYRDAWFVGYTPEIVTAVWVGYPDVQEAMTDVHGARVTGGSIPAQIWAAYMKKAVKNIPVSHFSSPEAAGWISVEVCAESHLLPTEFCPRISEILVRSGDMPAEQCDIHKPEERNVPEVVGVQLQTARAMIEEAGFEVSVSEEPVSAEPPGTVIAQSPPAGIRLLQGSPVHLVVSKADGSYAAVPLVAGLSAVEARSVLSDAGLTSAETSVADVAPVGTVISQDVEPGTLLRKGTAVGLTISSGSQQPPP